MWIMNECGLWLKKAFGELRTNNDIIDTYYQFSPNILEENFNGMLSLCVIFRKYGHLLTTVFCVW